MNWTKRTAPGLPAKAVATPTIDLLTRLPRTDRSGKNASRGRADPAYGRTSDFGPISRAEMREIVAEMIG